MMAWASCAGFYVDEVQSRSPDPRTPAGRQFRCCTGANLPALLSAVHRVFASASRRSPGPALQRTAAGMVRAAPPGVFPQASGIDFARANRVGGRRILRTYSGVYPARGPEAANSVDARLFEREVRPDAGRRMACRTRLGAAVASCAGFGGRSIHAGGRRAFSRRLFLTRSTAWRLRGRRSRANRAGFSRPEGIALFAAVPPL